MNNSQNIDPKSQVAKEIKSDLLDALLDIYPEHIDGEVGVGKFRTEFHRIYQDGDGWMSGNKATYVIVEVMGKLCKFYKKESGYSDKWFMQHTSGGASPIDLNQEEIFGHKIRNYEVTQKHRENGTLEASMR